MDLINNNITIDTILNGKVTLKQLKSGYRVGIDAVLLASTVQNADSKDSNIKILDLGAGVGALSLCILYRLPSAVISSIEKVPQYYNLCNENILLNSFVNGRYTPYLGDITEFKLLFNSFDVVVSNPPYYKSTESRKAVDPLKALANTESTAKLQDFIKVAYNYLKPKGKLYIIQKTPRILEILNSINPNYWGEVTLHPIYSYENKNAETTIVVMKKLSKEPFKITNGIVIHNKDNSYTEEALAIISKAKGFFEVTKEK